MYWVKFEEEDFVDNGDYYEAIYPRICRDCWEPNEWIRIDANVSFWGCRKCWYKSQMKKAFLTLSSNFFNLFKVIFSR